MHIQKDFEELLKLLEKHKIEYLVVGGYAVAFHGHPRFTKDIDIYYKNEIDNVQKIQAALVEFGFKKRDFTDDLFLKTGNIIKFGIEPVRVDFINEIAGIEFKSAWKNRIRGKYGKVEISFIGKKELIKNKSSTKRPQDKADAQELKAE